MRIIIVNQPTNNRGDEAAHKAFVRSLAKKFESAEFRVIFFHVDDKSIEAMNTHINNVEYVNIKKGFQKKKYDLIKNAFKYRCEDLLQVFPQFRALKNAISWADYVISAPGGICLGAFHNWEHAYILYLANKLQKPIAYYSRSFGPFPEKTKDDVVFNSLALELLSSFKFLSVRDSQTMNIADGLGINYFKAIDTAFLNNPQDCNYHVKGDYCVIVPNSLSWHPYYRKYNQSLIDNFYIELFSLISEIFPSLTICLLPQLFNKKDGGDYAYFQSLKNQSSLKCIHVIDDKLNSDAQQEIISKAKFCIGARYHSIVFAINNCTPFVSLSYEHKMIGLLSILNLDDRSVNMQDVLEGKIFFCEALSKIELLLKTDYNITESKNLARNIAKECEAKLIKSINHYGD